MWKRLVNESQLIEWVEAAEGIKDHFGIDRALGRLIGEKFYGIVSTLHFSRKLIRTIDEERKKPDYNPIGITIYKNHKLVTNLQEIYKKESAIITEIEDALIFGDMMKYFQISLNNHNI